MTLPFQPRQTKQRSVFMLLSLLSLLLLSWNWPPISLALVNKLPYFPAFGCPYLQATTSSLISDGQPLIECQSCQQQDCPGSEIFQLGLTVLRCCVSPACRLSSLSRQFPTTPSQEAVPLIHLTSIYLLVYLQIICASMHICTFLSIYLPICLSVYLSIYAFTHLSSFGSVSLKNPE